MSRHVRKLGAALALGFAGGVAAPVIVYVSLTHLGAPRAETRPAQQLALEMEPSTPPALPVVTEAPVAAPAPAPAAKHHRHASRRTASVAPAGPAEVVVPRGNPADLGRHIPTVPDAPQ